MKSDVNLCSDLRKKFNDNFKSGNLNFRSFHDLLWQIAVNRILDNETLPVIFHVNVLGEHGYELVLSYQSGGYKSTRVYFVSTDYSECMRITENINELFFQVDKIEQMKIISKSMFSNA